MKIMTNVYHRRRWTSERQYYHARNSKWRHDEPMKTPCFGDFKENQTFSHKFYQN